MNKEDYKTQAENLRQTLLNYIDCMQEVQLEKEKLIEDIAFSESRLKARANLIVELEATIKNLRASRKEVEQTAELYKALVLERDKKIKTLSETLEDLYGQIHEAKQEVQDYCESLEDEQIWSDSLAQENKQLKQKVGEQEDEIKELKEQYKKVNENTLVLLSRIHELEAVLHIDGRKKS